jgi:hypothetical protein
MEPHDSVPKAPADLSATAVRRAWAAPRFEVIDIAESTRAGVGVNNDDTNANQS